MHSNSNWRHLIRRFALATWKGDTQRMKKKTRRRKSERTFQQKRMTLCQLIMTLDSRVSFFLSLSFCCLLSLRGSNSISSSIAAAATALDELSFGASARESTCALLVARASWFVDQQRALCFECFECALCCSSSVRRATTYSARSKQQQCNQIDCVHEQAAHTANFSPPTKAKWFVVEQSFRLCVCVCVCSTNSLE